MKTLRAIYRHKPLFNALVRIAGGCVLAAAGAMIACDAPQVPTHESPMFWTGAAAVITGLSLIITGTIDYDRLH